jgi:hypothetical protein
MHVRSSIGELPIRNIHLYCFILSFELSLDFISTRPIYRDLHDVSKIPIEAVVITWLFLDTFLDFLRII